MTTTHAAAPRRLGARTASWSSRSTRTCARPCAARGSTRSATPRVVRRIAEAVVARPRRAQPDRRRSRRCADVDAVVGELVARVSGFGPLQPFLDDPTVEEVWINDPSRVFVARRRPARADQPDAHHARRCRSWSSGCSSRSGRRIDLSQPFVDAMLPEGHRLHVVLEGISRGFSAVNIRKFVAHAPPGCTTWSSSAA